MHRQKGASLRHAKPRLEVPIRKSIKFPKIRLSQIMNGENEMVGRQKVILINSNLTLITYQTLVYILKPSDAEEEAEAEAPEAVDLWWKRKQKRKRLEICRFRFRSVSKLLFKFW
jgi:hypothetical protein